MKSYWMWAPLALLAAATSAQAADCSVEINSDDRMTFSTNEIVIPKSCSEFQVTLKHVGQMPAAAMGHNWVLSKTADMMAIAQGGLSAGLDKGYLNDSDERIIAHTRMIGGGESDTVSFKVSALKDGESYSFFCSFPGHVAIMKGTVRVE